jgi:hypothetical protein
MFVLGWLDKVDLHGSGRTLMTGEDAFETREGYPVHTSH